MLGLDAGYGVSRIKSGDLGAGLEHRLYSLVLAWKLGVGQMGLSGMGWPLDVGSWTDWGWEGSMESRIRQAAS